MSLAQRNLFQNKVRLSLSAVGVALSVMLILILNGFLTGVHRQATAYLDNSPGSVVVVQEGIRNFFAASSVLPPGTVTSVRETKGVSQALGIASSSSSSSSMMRSRAPRSWATIRSQVAVPGSFPKGETSGLTTRRWSTARSPRPITFR